MEIYSQDIDILHIYKKRKVEDLGSRKLANKDPVV